MTERGPGAFPWEDERAAGGRGERPQPDVAAAQDEERDEHGRQGMTLEPGVEQATPAPSEGGPQEGDAADVHAGERTAAAGQRRDTSQRPVVRKEYYSISEVADIVGLPAHVLRYWESQFSVLNPSKNRSGNRVYQRKEIKLILLVKQLLHDEKYTVEGAKQKLEQLRKGGDVGAATARALDEQLVHVLREELQSLNRLLDVERA